MPAIITLRGELHCFSCSRYLGEFESHPQAHGPRDVHFIEPPEGPLPFHAVQTDRGLRCSACNGRAVAEYIDRVAA